MSLRLILNQHSPFPAQLLSRSLSGSTLVVMRTASRPASIASIWPEPTDGTQEEWCMLRHFHSLLAQQIACRSLHWRHNDHDGVSNHQSHGCLLNRLFRHSSKKTSKLRVPGLCVGNSPGPVSSPHKGPVTRKMFPFDDVIMQIACR